MHLSGQIPRIAAACKRYGPGRLPYAERRSIGAGYAGASGALAASLGFIFLMGTLELLEAPFGLEPIPSFVGVVSIPLVVPAAFVAAALTWRFLPERTPYFGFVAGLVATVGTYVGGLLLLILWFAALNSGLAAIQEATLFAAVVTVFAFLFTFWITLPVGSVGGYIYQQTLDLENTGPSSLE